MNTPHTLNPVEATASAGKSGRPIGISPCRALALSIVLFALPVAAQFGPSFVKQPASLSRSLGDRAIFILSVRGDDPLSFQWQFNGSPVSGATNRSLTLTNLTADQAGTYTVIVSNAVSTVTSDPALLNVNTLFSFQAGSPVTRDGAFGVAWGDYDDDGFSDLAMTGFSNNLLYHNNRNGTFSKVPRSNPLTNRGYLSSWDLMWADYDNDGHLDLFVPLGTDPSLERDQLFRGLGDGGFQFVPKVPMVTNNFANMDAVWGDFDNDGRLDLFESRVNPDFSTAPQLLYWAESDGTFSQVESADFAQDPLRTGYGVTAGDFNGDGRRDIALALGRGAIMIYQNQGGRKFEPFLQPGSGSFIGGSAAGDYDNDGDLDLFVALAKGHCQLLRNDGTGVFELIEDGEMVTEPGRAIGATWGDYDNDGWLDLFVPRTANYTQDGDWKDSLFHNNGDGTFTRVAAGSVTNDDVDSWGAAWADYDNDGCLDLAVAVSNGTSRLYRNSGNSNGWLELKLVGTKSNRSALGAKVRIFPNFVQGTVAPADAPRGFQHREVGVGAGFSQNDLRVHFGLGDQKVVNRITIDWPSGQTQTLTNLAAKQILTVVEPGGAPRLSVSADGVLHLEGDPNTTYTLEAVSQLTEAWLPFLDGATGESKITTDGNGKATANVAEPAGHTPPHSGVIFFRVRVP